MKDLFIVLEVAATTAQSFYAPVPCRGNVCSVKAVYDAEMDADETVTIGRGATTVNLVTPTAALAAGNVIDGVPDTTNKALIFDPDSTTAANKVLKISVPDTVDSAGTLVLLVEYDDSAYVEQAASEA
ncbi:hypothetical protein KA005_18410 [bacterium]|nr:hypothetical protein [bacterium]